ncbi:MAG: glycosyltransferase family 2 protein [Bacteroidota bacterium]
MEIKNKLSILIPCYNEEKTIILLLDRIFNVLLICNTDKEIIIVDDASTDQTYSLLTAYLSSHSDLPIQIYQQKQNSGKGSCLHIAASKAGGNIIVIQDADLEYDPQDYNRLLKPILEGYADIVFGSRFMGSGPHRVLFFFHTIGNKVLTFFSNLFTQINLTDMETGYKMFRADILNKIRLEESRFGFEPEFTAKISRIKGIRIYEVGISYFGRTYEDGKKINWKDGIHSLYCILKYNIFKRR